MFRRAIIDTLIFFIKRPLFFLNMINFVLMFLIFPSINFINIYWLSLPTIYFLYHRQYKNIFIIWFFFLFSWYCVFTRCLADIDSILIGGEHTDRLHFYLSFEYCRSFDWDYVGRGGVGLKDFRPIVSNLLGNFCLETLRILDFISRKLGFPIYIPSIFKGLLSICNFILGGKRY